VIPGEHTTPKGALSASCLFETSIHNTLPVLPAHGNPMTDLPRKVWTDHTGQDIAEYAES
jgi:hypothetical protein